MNDDPCCFEPTFTLNGIPILPGGCQGCFFIRLYALARGEIIADATALGAGVRQGAHFLIRQESLFPVIQKVYSHNLIRRQHIFCYCLLASQ